MHYYCSTISFDSLNYRGSILNVFDKNRGKKTTKQTTKVIVNESKYIEHVLLEPEYARNILSSK